MTVVIEHVETGTSALLFTFLCTDEDDIRGDFEDTGGAIPCPPTGGVYAPQNPFSVFIGEDLAGTWRLTIIDGGNFDGGSLESWTLELCTSAPRICPSDYILTGTESMSTDYETDGIIESKQTINSNATVDYDSGTSILLQSDFETVPGVTFHAFIDGCNGTMLNQETTTLSEDK